VELVSTRSTLELFTDSQRFWGCYSFRHSYAPTYAALSLTLLALLPASAFAHKQETGFIDRAITVSGRAYRYQVFVPYNWDKHKKWPGNPVSARRS